MTLYRVTWIIDLETDNPSAAAVKALGYLRNPDSDVTCFHVKNLATSQTTTVDLGIYRT